MKYVLIDTSIKIFKLNPEVGQLTVSLNMTISVNHEITMTCLLTLNTLSMNPLKIFRL